MILLSNDDGIDAEGLQTLYHTLCAQYTKDEIWVVAPMYEQSGKSHSLSLHTPLLCKKRAAQVFAVDGTPADCINIALQDLLPRYPDVVIAGINNGANLGTDIIYSGTVAAARQACFYNIPAIAVSLCIEFGSAHTQSNYDYLATFIASYVHKWQQELYNKRVLLNINGPDAPTSDTCMAMPARRMYHNMIKKWNIDDTASYFYYFGMQADTHNMYSSISDYEAVQAGRIAISVIEIEPMYDTSSNALMVSGI